MVGLLLLGLGTIIERSPVLVLGIGALVVCLTAWVDRPSLRSALPLAWLLWGSALYGWRVLGAPEIGVPPAAIYLLTALDRRAIHSVERGVVLLAAAAALFVPGAGWIAALAGLWRVRSLVAGKSPGLVTQWLIVTFFVNAVVFLPGYVLRSGRNKFLPLAPDRLEGLVPSWDWGALPYYASSLFFARDNIDIFRGHLEVTVAMVVLLIWPRIFVARLVAVVTFFAVLLTAYHDVTMAQLGRGPAWRMDLFFLTPLLDYLGSAFGMAAFVAAAMVIGSVLFVLLVIAGRTGPWLRKLETIELVGRQRWGAAIVLVALTSHVGGLRAHSERRQTRAATTELMENVQRSADLSLAGVKSRQAMIDRFAEEPPPPLENADQNVYVFMVESYGRALWSDKEYFRHWESTTQALESDLESAGWAGRSAWAETTVCGGGSWMSSASLHLGFPFRHQPNYDSVDYETPVRWAAVPHSLLQVLASSGYETVSVQPGHIQRRLTVLWGAQHHFNARALRYTGEPFGYGGIPDQYALRRVDEQLPETRPRALFFENVSSHHPWIIPKLVDPADALDPGRYVSARADERPRYVRAVVYSMNVLSQFLADRTGVAVIVGDHQPPFHCGANEPKQVPLHVLATDPRRVARFFDGVSSQPGFAMSPEKPSELGIWDVSSRLIKALRDP
ncbi:MAG: hypothetical protein AAFU77_08480 [Myxococcota bacterium]